MCTGSWKEETNHKRETGPVLKGILNQRDPTGLPKEAGFGAVGKQELHVFFSLADAFSPFMVFGSHLGRLCSQTEGNAAVRGGESGLLAPESHLRKPCAM